MLRMMLFGLTLVLVAALVVIAIAYLRLNGEIEGDVKRLVASARPVNAIVTEEMVAALPAPAQRYLRKSGVIGQPIPSIVRLQQKGRIRSSSEANWMEFEASETYSTNPPAFVWRAWFPTPFMPVVMGRDEYLDGEGSIFMRMLALFPVAEERGDVLKAAGLMRYLNEMTWFPAAFLGSNLTITAAGPDSFKVALTDRGATAEAELFVDAEGRFVNFRALRFNTGTRSIETWETPITQWKTFGALELPSHGAAVWKLPGGDLTYIELDVTDVTYE
ncbi:MAG TPA: DUF6544 family protein [Devosia sp.]|nr:DUF6544 family protein [Devosia sp.]